MTFDEFQVEARKTYNPYITGEMAIVEGVMGLSAEAGEALDLVKKAMFQGHELDLEKLAEELGDVMFYMSRAADAIDMTMSVIAKRNNEKLSARYPEGFEAERSKNRVNH